MTVEELIVLLRDHDPALEVVVDDPYFSRLHAPVLRVLASYETGKPSMLALLAPGQDLADFRRRLADLGGPAGDGPGESG